MYTILSVDARSYVVKEVEGVCTELVGKKITTALEILHQRSGAEVIEVSFNRETYRTEYLIKEQTTKRFEYVFVVGNTKGFVMSVGFAQESGSLQEKLTDFGRAGFEVVATESFTDNNGNVRIQYLLKREY